eukprot:CAMPEP_0169352178 /NCGR_PEP_ID=MMETSP1017-20121227/25192_1 /TAXON_ID=342587 /ORGANISM="Karlodinium micrum, Strain CCMP2283" /LENGTH=106 /DNA_ID=CAMNT_0009448525 /DNA_START=268 /DNA_END=588 /DNA_ORIENTATION=+
MQAFPQLPIANNLRHLHTDGVPVDIEDNTCATMVEAIRHALLYGSIDNNINIITALEHREVTGHARHPLAFVFFGEFVACAMTVTPRFGASGSHDAKLAASNVQRK